MNVTIIEVQHIQIALNSTVLHSVSSIYYVAHVTLIMLQYTPKCDFLQSLKTFFFLVYV